ncbi:hypothetical protein CVV65_05480 [Kyrpidia spormannii]|uniref:Nuclease SbcCD subunit C n=1 Tax=Kyrpidia spormannii TaxID=2055160 RepID=A0A2K8N560_9BACL|nr:AAA family ATPase [Kyrpidia spormannii]ATY84474.1 hypothetical protein CVV65_05480 [Kyrpidia spormannii]
MQIRLHEWRYTNIRGIGSLEVNLERQPNEVYPITLLMMPNGTGKTTTMSLLRAIFSGEAEQWSPQQVRDFSPGPEFQNGEFRVAWSVADENKIKRYVVSLKLDYSNGIARYMTSTTGESGGLRDGWDPPNLLKPLLTKEFVRMFIFDGEVASDILDNKKNDAEGAISDLYHLNKLDEFKTEVDKLVSRKQQEKESKGTSHHISRLRNNVDSLRGTLQQLQTKESKLREELEQMEVRVNELEDYIQEYLSKNQELKKEEERIKNERDALSLALSNTVQQTLEILRQPHLVSELFSKRLNFLASSMRELRLPKSTSKQFFAELAEQKYCVCGRPIGEQEKKVILTQAEEYLGEDEFGVMNAIKSSINDLTKQEALLPDLVNRLSGLLERREELDRQWVQNRTWLEKSGDDQIREYIVEQTHLEDRIKDINHDLELLTTNDPSKQHGNDLNWKNNIPICRDELEEAQRRLRVVTDTARLVSQANLLKDYVDSIKRFALEKLKEKVKNRTNNKIDQIIKNDSLRIKSINRYLMLENKSGASVGQTLSIAYAFLASLFEESSYEFPFVVDSPANSLDLEVRRHVAPILPQIFKQVVVFLISSEREGFVESFYEMEGGVQFLTIYRGNNGEVFNYEGREIFSKFQTTVEG